MKKTVVLILSICLLLPLLVACGGTNESKNDSAAESAEESKAESIFVDEETARKAIVETALAYYRKNPYMQYDARSTTIEGPHYGPCRVTQNAAPEYASADQFHYSQCTEFTLDIMYNCFGWTFWNGVKVPHTPIGEEWETYKAGVVYRKDNITTANANEMMTEMKAQLLPGDIIISYATTSGHALMWLGDCLGDGKNYVIHCWGGSAEIADKVDKTEAKGSIYLQAEDEVIWGKGSGPSWSLLREQKYVQIVRFYTDPQYTLMLTPAAQSRIQYTGLTIDRYATGVTQYNDVPTGSKLEINVSVKNSSKNDYTGIKIKEALPATGVTLDAGQELEWTVDIPAGKTVTKSYTVTVTAARGEVIDFPAGSVEMIATRELEYKVSGKQFTKEQQSVFTSLQNGVAQGVSGTELAYVKALYKEALGLELNIPDSVSELIKLMLKKKNGLSAEAMLTKKDVDDTNKYLFDMAVNKMISGRYVTLGADAPSTRVLSLDESLLQPGDIMVAMQEQNTIEVALAKFNKVYIYLGNGKVMNITPSEVTIDTFANTFGFYYWYNMWMVLRPTLAIDDVTTATVNKNIKIVDANAHSHCECGENCATATAANGHTCATISDWTAWDGKNNSANKGGNFYLTADLTLDNQLTLQANATVRLCLNGHTLTTANEKKRAFSCNNANTTLIICDCSKDHTGKVVSASVNADSARSLFNFNGKIYGGTFDTSACTGATFAGCMSVNGGRVVDIYGGTFIGNKVVGVSGEATAVGGVLSTAGGSTINIYGGTIKGGEATFGGAISVSEGATLNIAKDVVIEDCKSENGIIYVSDGTVNGEKLTAKEFVR